MSRGLKKKYETILARERTLANSIARAVVRPKPIGVWDIMIPMIFILNYLKGKHAKELFIQNYIFTKKLALQAALDMLQGGKSREEVMNAVRDKTKVVLKGGGGGVYSEQIRSKQMKEIAVLMDHYHTLLDTDGKDYDTLVVSAYGDRRTYTEFVKSLETCEKAVLEAARQTLGDQTDSAALIRLEEATARVRGVEINRIFGS